MVEVSVPCSPCNTSTRIKFLCDMNEHLQYFMEVYFKKIHRRTGTAVLLNVAGHPQSEHPVVRRDGRKVML